jgi:hypothetical protein
MGIDVGIFEEGSWGYKKTLPGYLAGLNGFLDRGMLIPDSRLT